VTAGLGYAVLGPGGADVPVLVLGSSVGTDRGLWQPQRDALAKRFRVVAFDHRGHGASEVPTGPYTMADLGGDVVALLDGLGVGRFGYAGLSLGGMVGMWLAAHVPDRVARLALLCTSAHLPPAEHWLDRAAAVRAGGTGAVADAVVPRWFTAGFPGEQPDAVARCRAMLLGTPGEGYAGCCEAIATMNLLGVLDRITAPTLVVAGDADRATPVEHARSIVDAVAGARLAVVPRAAHLANVEQPGAVTDLLIDHFAPLTGG
jgi:3-oxoadipate enol-lactonase